MRGENAFEHGGKWLMMLQNWDINKGTLLDFSANINPFGLAASVSDAIDRAMPNILHYPDSEGTELKQAISCHYNVDKESILLGNGAVELLYLLCQCRRPKRILIPAPTFSEYERAALAVGASVDYFLLRETDDFELSFINMEKQLSQAEMIFICNPNNPTGKLVKRNEIQRILDATMNQECLVVVDESFMDFVTNAEEYTCRRLLQNYPQLCIIHSLTKFYAIPGLRLGFMLANSIMIENLNFKKDPWNVNTLAQSAGVAGLTDRQYQADSRQYVNEERQWLQAALTVIPGLVVYSGRANFLLLNIVGFDMLASEFTHRLAGFGILVRDCSNYPGLNNYYIRVAVRSRKENQRLVTSIRQVV